MPEPQLKEFKSYLDKKIQGAQAKIDELQAECQTLDKRKGELAIEIANW